MQLQPKISFRVSHAAGLNAKADDRPAGKLKMFIARDLIRTLPAADPHILLCH
jgi:hypothetical protein